MDVNQPTTEFLGQLGHEMRNPLSVLSNALELWPTSAHDPVLMEELRHIMERQVRHLIRLSDELLDVTQTAQGQFKLPREECRLGTARNDAAHEKPSVTKPPTEKRNAEGRDGDGSRLPAYRILVVDDDRSSTELLAGLLRSLDQVVTVAEEGEMAIRQALENRPQIVFLDIVMSGMDGCDVARRLRGHPELAGLVLVALSGNGDDESMRHAMQAGFDKYLVKPTSLTALAETLFEVSARRVGGI